MVLGFAARIDSAQVSQVRIPFSGEQIPLSGVTLLTCGYTIAFAAAPAAHQGDKVVEGELFGCNLGVAVVAAPFGNTILPPLALAQFACSIALFAQLLFGDVGKNIHAQMMA